MDFKTQQTLIRSHQMPKDILDFIEKNGSHVSSKNWYSEFGQLKTGK